MHRKQITKFMALLLLRKNSEKVAEERIYLQAGKTEL
jgi:hypothetical protein